MTITRQRLAFAFSIVAATSALVPSASAQFAGGRAAFDQRRGLEAVQFRDFFWGDRGSSNPNNSFDPFGGGRRSTHPSSPYDPYSPSYRRPQVIEATKPPAPHKVETPSTETVVVIGDSLADWLGYGLEQVFAETPEIGIVRKIKPDFGLARDDARQDAPGWLQATKDLLATEKPSAIVVMLGVNDRVPLRDRVPAAKAGGATPDHPAPAEGQRQPQAANSEFHTDKWAELYSQRIDDMIAALKTKGVPIVWVGLPAIRGTKSTSDMSYLDELYRARAEKAGITYVDVWDGFVDEQGHYTQQGPDFEGQIRRLRTYDGVNFTKFGAEKLGHYVEKDLLPLLSSSHVLPVALPSPEEQAPTKGATVAPPPVGPVVPLNAIGDKGGDLLGAANAPAERPADPLATHVLKNGDAIVAPPGRADDFSWPRADTKDGDAADVAPVPATLPAGALPAKGSASTNSDDGNNDKKGEPEPKALRDAKNSAAQSTVPPRRRLTVAKPRRPSDQLDGAPPRPSLPVGPSFSNSR